MKLDLRVDFESFSIENLLSVLNGKLQGSLSMPIQGVCLDSRILLPGDLFFAIHGERDGHEFVDKALEKGACAVVVDHSVDVEGPSILVENTLKALHSLAHAWRIQWGNQDQSRKVIGISGSSGKTTTKEMLGYLLGPQAHISPGSWNNHLGVPLTLLSLTSKDRWAVIEMGMNHYGELFALSKMARPDVAALTNIGRAHLEFFGSIENIAKAKKELFDALPSSSCAVIRMDDPLLRAMASALPSQKILISRQEAADLAMRHVMMNSEGFSFDLYEKENDSSTSFQTNLRAFHQMDNLLVCLGILKALGMNVEKQPSRLMFPTVSQRFEIFASSRGYFFVDDSYNANPDSTRASLRQAQSMKKKRLIFVFGEMGELGEKSPDEHQKLANELIDFGVDQLYYAGNHSQSIQKGFLDSGKDSSSLHIHSDKESLIKELEQDLQEGDLVLIKASNMMGYSKIVQSLKERG